MIKQAPRRRGRRTLLANGSWNAQQVRCRLAGRIDCAGKRATSLARELDKLEDGDGNQPEREGE